MPWLGSRRPDDPRCRPQAVPARDEHVAGDDWAFAGADVGQGGGHLVRAAVPDAARRGASRRAAPVPTARRAVGAGRSLTAMPRSTTTTMAPLPFDVRLAQVG